MAFFPFLSNSRLSALVPASLRRAPPPCCAAAPRSALPCASTSGASPTVDLAVVNPHCCEHGAFLSSLLIVPRVTKTLGMSHQCALCLALHLRLGYPALEPSLRLCTSGSPVGPPGAAGLLGPRIAASVLLWATADRCFGGVLYLCFAIIDGPASTTPPFLEPYYLPLAQQSALFLSTGEFPPNVPVAPFLL
ncbi:hypothetical protein SORBI_3001G311833 [Sorghum bicolor]|uniref:Uncharacterized protein n=1 Tax=Sorghum bicolor TaxID=4558 RepID=A0A1Z5S8R2_SORBI|nr:hypothetical protein SORBI_3001G311833 [Sorghum bicolor]